jgi:hypothetical protein
MDRFISEFILMGLVLFALKQLEPVALRLFGVFCSWVASWPWVQHLETRWKARQLRKRAEEAWGTRQAADAWERLFGKDAS